MTDVEFVMLPRNAEIGQMITDCAEGRLKYTDLYRWFHDHGWSTTSLYEMVMAATPPKPAPPKSRKKP